jgi:hypothetical protein
MNDMIPFIKNLFADLAASTGGEIRQPTSGEAIDKTVAPA